MIGMTLPASKNSRRATRFCCLGDAMNVSLLGDQVYDVSGESSVFDL